MLRLLSVLFNLITVGLFFAVVIIGFYFSITKGYKKIKETMVDENGNFGYEEKKKILDVIKIFIGAQMVGVLFYITPTINETIKIALSLIITLGMFFGAFVIGDKKGQNAICRILIFLGQEFFGITLILLMVNKGMSYTTNSIFAIWTVFNLFIYKTCKKTENRLFFIGTLIVLLFSLIFTYGGNVELHILIAGVTVILLAIHFFGEKNNIVIRILKNLMLGILSLATFVAIINEVPNQGIILATTIILIVALLPTLIIPKKLNIKALFAYLPYIISLFLLETEIELLWFLSIFNVIAVIWLLADKSICKKLLCAFILFITTGAVIPNVVIDEGIAIFIYLGSIIFTYTYLFAPTRPIEVKEGGTKNEQ